MPAAQPQRPNPAPGRAVTSWRFNGWRGRAWTQRAGGGTARPSSARCRARLQPGLGSGPAGYFRREAVAKFPSRAWCLPRDEFIGIGQWWFARLWLSGSPVGRFLIRIYVCVYIYLCIYLQVHPPARDALAAGSLSGWVRSFHGGWSGRGALQAWGQSPAAPLSIRNVQHRSRDNLVEFGSFTPSHAPVVGFDCPLCRAHVAGQWPHTWPSLRWDPGRQKSHTQAVVLGSEVGNVPGRGHPASCEGFFLRRIHKTLRSALSVLGSPAVSRVRSGRAASKPWWREKGALTAVPSASLVCRAREGKGIPWEHGLFSQLQEQLSCWCEGRYQ